MLVMLNNWFLVHDGLQSAARLRAGGRVNREISFAEVLLLLACGAVSAVAVGFAKLGLGIPGHVIVLAVVPMALGLSVAPRHLAGSVMSAGAFGTATALSAFGTTTYGAGAIVSLCVIGPMMDVALRHVRGGKQLYLRLVLAGVAANLLALGSRAGAKLLGLDLAGARPFDSWWLQALGTYTASGLVAGLLGALCWFHLNDRRHHGSPT